MHHAVAPITASECTCAAASEPLVAINLHESFRIWYASPLRTYLHVYMKANRVEAPACVSFDKVGMPGHCTYEFMDNLKKSQGSLTASPRKTERMRGRQVVHLYVLQDLAPLSHVGLQRDPFLHRVHYYSLLETYSTHLNAFWAGVLAQLPSPHPNAYAHS